MPQLRLISSLAPFAALLFALSLAGCGGGDQDDAGPEPVDEGPMPDEGPVGMCGPPAGECPFNVPGTCGAGQGCVLVGPDPVWTTACGVAGTLTDGQTCDPTRPNQCADGFLCSADELVCRSYCCDNADCSPGQQCLEIIDAFGAGVCVGGANCELPFPQPADQCPDGQACYVAGSQVLCSMEGTVQEGESCDGMGFNACAAGHVCIQGEPSTCRRLCDFDLPVEQRCAQDPALPENYVCNPLGDLTDTGVCIPM